MPPKKDAQSASQSAVVFQACMCRANPATALFQPPAGEATNHVSLNCVVQKIQSKAGVFVMEDVYGLEVLTGNNDEKAVAPPAASATTDGETSTPIDEYAGADAAGECVICLTDPRSVALYPCRHLCVCM
jgi:hypothetical protein